MIRLLLVDDHELFRSGLRSVLAEAGDIEVVGEVADGEAAVDFVRRDPPDVVLMASTCPVSAVSRPRGVLCMRSRMCV